MELTPLPASFTVAPWRLSGVVYGALVNHTAQLAALGDAVHAAPYKAPPAHAVLQVRPRNTLCGPGSAVAVPADPGVVDVGVSLGIVIGRTACRVAAEDAPGVVAGYLVAAELGLPTESHYRPAVRLKARDGFTVLGPVVPAAEVDDPDQLATWVQVDGEARHQGSTAGRVRGVAELIAAVTEFMTLQPGDVLLLGADSPAPRAAAGTAVTLGIADLGSLSFSLVAEAVAAPALADPSPIGDGTQLAPRGAVARVAHAGAVHTAWPHPQGVQLADGRVLREDEVQWLPPFEVGTILALGLNYADHVKELSKELTVTAKDEPLVFLKGPGALVGHRGLTRRPAGVAFMHYECELAVVIGKAARHVAAKDAMAHVAGYTVCNDYAIRDYLENWYRPNLRVKNRDGATALGPWFVPAADVPNPHALTLRTLVNGQVTQQGSTANMVNDIPALIEYLSEFMTLQAGDVILTGTPEGVVNVNEGDEVVCEIAGIGRLVNTIVGDAAFSVIPA
ncbi:MAG: fumarylacetoacetate hydrolase family protein [Burkholderiales bacterium]|nr:fumarylacetoacetate hydrolase family protein [Burkholderiales bacterium]